MALIAIVRSVIMSHESRHITSQPAHPNTVGNPVSADACELYSRATPGNSRIT